VSRAVDNGNNIKRIHFFIAGNVYETENDGLGDGKGRRNVHEICWVGWLVCSAFRYDLFKHSGLCMVMKCPKVEGSEQWGVQCSEVK
jgi:hypothetical protein